MMCEYRREDELMVRAAQEALAIWDREFMSRILDAYQYSDRFERKMRELSRIDRKRQWLNQVASVTVALLFGVLLTLSANSTARAAALHWIKEIYDIGISYIGTVDESIEEETLNYQLKYIPDGYSITKEDNSYGMQLIVYKNDQNQQMSMMAATMDNGTALSINTDETTIFPIRIHGKPADLYLSTTGEANTLVWEDDSTHTILCLTGEFDEDVLVKIAENIILKK